MKKSYLMIAAAAMVMVSCADTYELRNDIKGESSPVKIDFASFAEKATRGDVTDKSNLEFYHNTFSVYASKKSTVNNEVSYPFDAQLVTYASGSATPNEWTYSPYRYWDKQSEYQFIAVAPNNEFVKYAVSSGDVIASGDFVSAQPFKLHGQNLQATATTAQIWKGFTGLNASGDPDASGDVDIMTSARVDRNGATVNGSNKHDDVTLIFKHILAKLNIKIAKAAILDDAIVRIKDIKIKGLDNTGTYAESNYAASSDASADANICLTSGWTIVSGDADYVLSYYNASGDALNASSGDAKYYIESLVMPQAISGENMILKYEIETPGVASGDAHIEPYTYKLEFDGLFGGEFLDRSNYTLSLTIEPDVIKFDATAEDWYERTVVDKTVY